MKFETNDIKMIYNHLQDDLSRLVFSQRLMYNLTDDWSYMQRVIDVIPYGFNGFFEELRRHEGQRIIFFGAGVDGGLIYEMVRNCFPALQCICFVDNSNRKHGMMYCGLPVVSFAELMEKYRDDCVIIATNDYRDEVKKQLLSGGFPKGNIISSATGEDSPSKLYKKQYFDLSALPHDDNEIFVDGGVLDGSSTLEFIKWAGGKYKHAYLFEPNTEMRGTIENNLRGIEKFQCIDKGLWNEKAELAFEIDRSPLHTGGGSKLVADKKLAPHDALRVPVISLDEALGDTRVTFIKLDVEGSEKMALVGAEKIIRKYRPKLAVCVYHKKEDIWEIPKLLLNYHPDYAFYLRHYAFDACETVLYAI